MLVVSSITSVTITLIVGIVTTMPSFFINMELLLQLLANPCPHPRGAGLMQFYNTTKYLLYIRYKGNTSSNITFEM